MSIEVVADTPLARALQAAIEPKLLEQGLCTGGEDPAPMAEYIVLMLVNQKNQEQIATELANDILSLGPNDPRTQDFSQWLMQQVVVLNSQLNGGNHGGEALVADSELNTENGTQDLDMEGVSETGDNNVYAIPSLDLSEPDLRLPPKPPLTHNRPTGPKSMRNGATRGRDKRMLGHLTKHMDRPNDSVLHRVRPQNGNERINTHSRAPPNGPRGGNMAGRGGFRAPNNRGNHAMSGMPMQQGGAAANVMNMSPQQQMDLYAMLEQQSRLMAQMLGPQGMAMGNGMGNGMPNGFQQQQQPQSGRSLFDRTPRGGRGGHNGFQKGPQSNRYNGNQQNSEESAPSSSMDVEMSQGEKKELDPENTMCKFNLSCTVADCKFAHQSPAAPLGSTVDFGDTCSFGAACKNKKCTGKHPSPASHLQQICRFYPNCTNPVCSFRHPAKQCRNGGDCTIPNCHFAHTTTMCKFTPCTRPDCPFKHAEGQRGIYKDRVWTPNSGKEHVSERKFVDESGPEELVGVKAEAREEKPLSQESNNTAEIIT